MAFRKPPYQRRGVREVGSMKNIKLDIRLQHYFICHECTTKEFHTVVFYNDDDNVCRYCGSKNCEPLIQARLKAEVMDYEGRDEQIKRVNV